MFIRLPVISICHPGSCCLEIQFSVIVRNFPFSLKPNPYRAERLIHLYIFRRLLCLIQRLCSLKVTPFFCIHFCFFNILISHTGARIPRITRPQGIFVQTKCLCLSIPEHQRTDPSVSQRKCLLPDSCRRLKYHFHTLFPVFQLLIFLLPATFFISRFYLISHCLSGYFSLSFVIVQSLHSCKPIRLVKYCLLNNYYCSIFHTIAIGVSPSRYSWGITTCIPSSVIFHSASFFVSTMEIPRIFP